MNAPMNVAPRETISAAIRQAAAGGRPAVVGFMTAGFPDRAGFARDLHAVASAADVVEIGVPFSDPMADGATIQRASFASLQGGFTLPWLLQELEQLQPRPRAPLLLMSYLNPMLAYGLDALPGAAAEAGVAGFIIPDLPYEESADMRAALDRVGIALVQMVTPVTPPARLEMLCRASQGFVYAVTMTGTTGKSVAVPDEVLAYMDRVKAVSPVPVCAGFGIRSRDQVVRMRGHVDGVVVGSALVEVLERREDPAAFLASLRP
ncbi:MAG TPA: tryptophan synthase subunit alpha [Steroidobacteraceae bacterium]|nr:tryptophan synthase subunit alpha [Steroidobacteraceae bacterium]